MESMDAIYRKYVKTVYGFLLIKTMDADLAEELTQETFYQAIKSIPKFNKNSSVSTWLCGIAKNVWHSHLKKTKRQDHISLEEMGEQNQPLTISLEQKVFQRIDSTNILEKLQKVKEPTRSVLYLRLVEDFSFRQIGDILERNENWARVTFFRGKERLVKEVSENE